MGKLRCPDCESTNIYYRSKTNIYHCVTCGEDFDKKLIKETWQNQQQQ